MHPLLEAFNLDSSILLWWYWRDSPSRLFFAPL